MTEIQLQYAGLLINGLIALGTIGAVVVALFQHRILSWIDPVRCSVSLDNPDGKDEKDSSEFRYHLVVKNLTRWRKVENCRVFLTGILRKEHNSTYTRTHFPVPRQFVWAPSENAPPAQTFSTSRKIDFAIFKNDLFHPELYNQGGDLNPDVSANQVVRWEIEVDAENMAEPIRETFEICWNGNFSTDTARRKTDLTIKKLPKNSSGSVWN